MLLTYSGPHDEVVVPAADVLARRGEPVEIEDEDLAKSLLDQDTWTAAKPRQRKTDEGDKS